MSVKQSGQFSFVDALLPSGVGRSDRLERFSGLVRWYRFEKMLARLRNEGSAGRPAYDPLVKFKALLLQSLYGLSDTELEDAVFDRRSFRSFVGLSLAEPVSDICAARRSSGIWPGAFNRQEDISALRI